MRVGHRFVSAGVGQSREVIVLSVPFLVLSAGESRLLLGFFFLSVPIGVSDLLASSSPHLGSMRQRHNPGNSPRAVPWALRSSADLPSSVHLSRSSYTCFISYALGFQLSW